jgi:hypothetical protein
MARHAPLIFQPSHQHFSIATSNVNHVSRATYR